MQYRCVVAITEQWTTTSQLIVNHWYPWLNFEDYTIARTTLLMGEGDEKTNAAFLRDELKEVIVRMNECDMKLYEKMLEMNEKQLEVAGSKYFSV